MLNRLLGRKTTHQPDPALKKVTVRLDQAEGRLTLIETELKVIKRGTTNG